MKLLNTSINNPSSLKLRRDKQAGVPRLTCETGFTLVEIVITMAILSIIMGFGLFIGMDVYRGYSFSAERDIAVSVLQRSRSRALNNLHSSPHGVYITASEYRMFVGNSYATQDASKEEIIPAHPSMILSGLSEVVFNQLSGDVSSGGILVLSADGHTASISINNEGSINW